MRGQGGSVVILELGKRRVGEVGAPGEVGEEGKAGRSTGIKILPFQVMGLTWES